MQNPDVPQRSAATQQQPHSNQQPPTDTTNAHALARLWFQVFSTLDLDDFCRSILYQAALVVKNEQDWQLQLPKHVAPYFTETHQAQVLRAVRIHLPDIEQIAYQFNTNESLYSINNLRKRYNQACVAQAKEQLAQSRFAHQLADCVGQIVLPCALALDKKFRLSDDVDFIDPNT